MKRDGLLIKIGIIFPHPTCTKVKKRENIICIYIYTHTFIYAAHLTYGLLFKIGIILAHPTCTILINIYIYIYCIHFGGNFWATYSSSNLHGKSKEKKEGKKKDPKLGFSYECLSVCLVINGGKTRAGIKSFFLILRILLVWLKKAQSNPNPIFLL